MAETLALIAVPLAEAEGSVTRRENTLVAVETGIAEREYQLRMREKGSIPGAGVKRNKRKGEEVGKGSLISIKRSKRSRYSQM